MTNYWGQWTFLLSVHITLRWDDNTPYLHGVIDLHKLGKWGWVNASV